MESSFESLFSADSWAFSDGFERGMPASKYLRWVQAMSEMDLARTVAPYARVHYLLRRHAEDGGALVIKPQESFLQRRGTGKLTRVNWALLDICGLYIRPSPYRDEQTWPGRRDLPGRLTRRTDTAWIADATDSKIACILEGMANLVLRMHMSGLADFPGPLFPGDPTLDRAFRDAMAEVTSARRFAYDASIERIRKRGVAMQPFL